MSALTFFLFRLLLDVMDENNMIEGYSIAAAVP